MENNDAVLEWWPNHKKELAYGPKMTESHEVRGIINSANRLLRRDKEVLHYGELKGDGFHFSQHHLTSELVSTFVY